MKILGWLKKAWAFITGDKLKAAISKIDSMIEIALPIVQEVAALTPTRSDDELVALFAKYRLSLQGWLGLPSDQRGAALLYAASARLQQYFPSVPIHQIQSAVQLAVTINKNR